MTTSSTTTTTTPTSESRGQYSPTFQLSTLAGDNSDTPLTTLSWGKREIRTPLNKMAQGKNSNWSETPDNIQVKIPRHQQFPKERIDEWRRKFSKLHPIPEEKVSKGSNTVSGPIKPTKSMLDLAEQITSKPYTTLKTADIVTPDSSEGITVAVAILMEMIKGHILPTGSKTQMHNLAHFLMATSTESLLYYLRDGDALGEFVHNRINRTDNILPPFDETKLHPYKTRSLVNDQDLWRRTEEWNRTDHACIILPFIQRFYPTETAAVRTAIQSGKLDTHLRDMIMVPGYFTSYWHAKGGDTTFAPPLWVDLHKETEQTNSVSLLGGSFDDDECPDMLDGFAPLNHMGKPAEDILRMTPANQKKQALTTLPNILKQLLSIESAANIMIKLAQTPETDFPTCLSPEGFQQCLQGAKQETEQPENTQEYRIRIRVRQERGRASSNIGEVARNWLLAVRDLVNRLKIPMRIISPPHAHAQQDIIVGNDIPDSEILGGYTVKMRQSAEKGTFDIWCVTPCATWGKHRFQYDATDAATAYYKTLETQGIMVADEESYPVELIPCVALVGSTNRDRNDLIKAEFGAQLERAGLDTTPFSVIWCSLRNAGNRSVMIKCIATTEEHKDAVVQMFQNIRTASITAFYPVTYLYAINIIPDSQDDKRMQEITEIIMSQRSREEDTIWVALIGLNNQDPFVFHPLEKDGRTSRYTLAEKILTGWEQDDDMEASATPVRNITADDTLTRCYLLAFKEDAEELIRYAKRIAPLFAGWVGSTSEVRVLTGVAEKWVQKDFKEPPTTVVSKQATSSTSALTTSTKTTDDKYNERFDQLTHLLEEHGQQLQQLQQILNTNTGEQAAATQQQDIVHTVTDTMKTAIDTIRDEIASHHSKQTTAITEQIEGLSISIKTKLSDAHTSQQETSELLMELVAHYNKSIENVNDSNLAYGNEIAMLRIMVDACTHRVNWLVEDIGSRMADKPPPPDQDRLSTQGMEAVLNAAHELYEEGGTRVDLALADRCIQAAYDHIGTQGSHDEGTDSIGKSGEGRQREPSPYPPLPTESPSKTPSTPTLPRSTGGTTNTTTVDPTPRDGYKRRTVGTEGEATTKDAQHTDDTQVNPGAEMTTYTLTAGWGNCSCCTKTSEALQACNMCGQLFHEDCIDNDKTSDMRMCTQCTRDHQVVDPEPSDSDMEESTSSSERTEGSSYSRRSPKRKTKSKLTKPQKYSKTAKLPTLSDRSTANQEEPLLTQPPSITTPPPLSETKTKKKSTQSTLTRRPDTGTIQIETIAHRLRNRPTSTTSNT